MGIRKEIIVYVDKELTKKERKNYKKENSSVMPVSSSAALSLQPQRGMDDAKSLAAHPGSEDHS